MKTKNLPAPHDRTTPAEENEIRLFHRFQRRLELRKFSVTFFQSSFRSGVRRSEPVKEIGGHKRLVISFPKRMIRGFPLRFRREVVGHHIKIKSRLLKLQPPFETLNENGSDPRIGEIERNLLSQTVYRGNGIRLYSGDGQKVAVRHFNRKAVVVRRNFAETFDKGAQILQFIRQVAAERVELIQNPHLLRTLSRDKREHAQFREIAIETDRIAGAGRDQK